MKQARTWIAATLIIGCVTANQTAIAQGTKTEIVHDAEYYVLAEQHSQQWAAEDQEINRKLAELRQKYGTPPNIIHIMWDDIAVGEVGIPAIQKVRGFETPNINRLAAEGINFMRMYTEPSCTPSRAAILTGRHPVRNGMYNVGFPYEYGGLLLRLRLRTCSPRPDTQRPSTARRMSVTSKPVT